MGSSQNLRTPRKFFLLVLVLVLDWVSGLDYDYEDDDEDDSVAAAPLRVLRFLLFPFSLASRDGATREVQIINDWLLGESFAPTRWLTAATWRSSSLRLKHRS